MGTCGADISAIEVVGKQIGFAVNDFMLTMPPGALPDSLVSACNTLEGVKVLWLSRYPDSWGIESDIETLNRMSEHPGEAAEILTEAAPTVFHVQWAALLDRAGQVTVCTELAPEINGSGEELFGDLGSVHRTNLAEGWLDGWAETTCAVAPVTRGGAIVLGRLGGPEFLDSELSRLKHLAGLAR